MVSRFIDWTTKKSIKCSTFVLKLAAFNRKTKLKWNQFGGIRLKSVNFSPDCRMIVTMLICYFIIRSVKRTKERLHVALPSSSTFVFSMFVCTTPDRVIPDNSTGPHDRLRFEHSCNRYLVRLRLSLGSAVSLNFRRTCSTCLTVTLDRFAMSIPWIECRQTIRHSNRRMTIAAIRQIWSRCRANKNKVKIFECKMIENRCIAGLSIWSDFETVNQIRKRRICCDHATDAVPWIRTKNQIKALQRPQVCGQCAYPGWPCSRCLSTRIRSDGCGIRIRLIRATQKDNPQWRRQVRQPQIKTKSKHERAR